MDESGGYTEFPFTAEFYDYVEPYQTRSDVPFFVEKAKASNGEVLELGCGTGRVLIPIARAGVPITGLDLSSSMLEVCRKKLLAEPVEVQRKAQILQGDMRNFDLQRQFALVIIPFRPFQHLLRVEDQLSCLHSIHRHLTSDGRFIFDLFNPSLPYLVDEKYQLELGEEPEFTLPDGRSVVRRSRIAGRDYFNQINDTELIYYVTYPDGSKERAVHRFQMRYLFRFEAEHMLARAGFEVEALYADYDYSPYGSKYPGELIFVARKTS